MITAGMVKELREKTGAGMMDCKKVLSETNGDMERAMELLRERGIAKAAKKSDRIAAEGVVYAYVNEDAKIGVMVEVNSETDFVAKNEDFQNFVAEVAKVISQENPADIEDLLTKPMEGKTVQEVLTDKIAKIGENMSIRRFVRYESEGMVESYIHGNGKIGVLVEITAPNKEVARDVCMQIAAAKPEYLNSASVPAEVLDKEMEILKAQAINEGKPEHIAEKIVQGRIGKFYSEICLVDQVFVKNSDLTIKQLLQQNNVDVVRFARYEKGEGFEKREENFAEEVMKQIQ